MTAAATFEDCCSDIAARLQLVQGGGEVYDLEQDSIVAPSLVVAPGPGDFIKYKPSMDDSCDYLITITAYRPGDNVVEAQRQLFLLLRKTGPTSVFAAVNGGNPALGVSYVVDVGSNMRGITTDGGARYLAVDWLVKVTA